MWYVAVPGQVTIRTDSSSSDALSISWEHQGGSDGYQLRITPFVTTDSGGGSEIINTTSNTYDFTGLDGESVYTIEVSDFYYSSSFHLKFTPSPQLNKNIA